MPPTRIKRLPQPILSLRRPAEHLLLLQSSGEGDSFRIDAVEVLQGAEVEVRGAGLDGWDVGAEAC